MQIPKLGLTMPPWVLGITSQAYVFNRIGYRRYNMAIGPSQYEDALYEYKNPHYEYKTIYSSSSYLYNDGSYTRKDGPYNETDPWW